MEKKTAKNLVNVLNGKERKMKYRAVLCPVGEEQEKVTRWLKRNPKVIYYGASYYNGKLVHMGYEADDATETEFCKFTEENFGW